MSADINHSLGFKTILDYMRTIIIFLTTEWIVTKIVDVLQCLGQVTH